MTYRVIPPNHAIEVTTSLEEGLLLSANPLCRFIIESAMARAQYLHPVTICHYLVEASHVHFMMYSTDPQEVVDFMERFKTETAHYLNTMLGRNKRTVWCESFYAAPILSLSSGMKKIRYIYTNPAKDNLESTIANFPGLSSWTAYRTGKLRKDIARLHRPMIPYLPGKFYPKHTYTRHTRDLKKRANETHTLTLSPDSWMKTFRVTDTQEMAKVNKGVVDMIQQQEHSFATLREAAGKTVIGREALAAAHLDLDYIPQRTSKKMWCICDDKDLRIRYIQWAKGIKQKARDVYNRWKVGDYSVPFPPGVFAPAKPKIANMAPLAYCY